jgi:dTDP-4-dehydrorhamnose reductase
LEKLRPIILGDGLLGKELHHQTGWTYLSRKKENFDIESNLEKFLVDSNKPITDTLINCIAHTDTYSEQRELHWKVNYEFVHRLIEFCNRYGIKLVHFSTDYLYTNSNPLASENDVPVHCNNWYGYTKLLGDGLVQLLSKKYLLIRCTHKLNPFPYDKAWIDQVGNFDYVDRISMIVVEMITKECSGVYNVGTELKSMYNLASKTRNVTPIISESHVPKNLSMSIDKIKKLNLENF